MKKWSQRISWDWIGISASLLCAVHCAALPFVLTISTLGGLSFLESPIIEGGMVLIALSVASFALIQSYRKSHRKKDAIYIAILGFGCILLGQVSELYTWEAIFNAIGGILVASAHVVNLRLSQFCSLAQ